MEPDVTKSQLANWVPSRTDEQKSKDDEIWTASIVPSDVVCLLDDEVSNAMGDQEVVDLCSNNKSDEDEASRWNFLSELLLKFYSSTDSRGETKRRPGLMGETVENLRFDERQDNPTKSKTGFATDMTFYEKRHCLPGTSTVSTKTSWTCWWRSVIPQMRTPRDVDLMFKIEFDKLKKAISKSTYKMGDH